MASSTDTEMASCTCRHRKAFVGIDMGATHAGISCVTYEDCQACGKKHDKVLQRTLLDKFPVLLAADSSLEDFRFVENEGALYHHERALTNFKLILPEVTSFQQQSQTEDIIRYIHKTTLDVARHRGEGIVVKLVKTYVDGLIKLTLEKMVEAFPRIQKEDMKIILTYPKFFQSSTGKAFSYFSQAINSLDMEGVPSINTLPEHNAALKASLYFAAGDLWRHHMANEWVVVADCGGMTDTVLYRIPAMNTDEDTTEIQHLNSTLGGGVWMDQAIDGYARQHLRTLPNGEDDVLFERRVQQVMDYWHKFVKPDFTTDRTSPPVLTLGNGVLFVYPMEIITGAFNDVILVIAKAVGELWQLGQTSRRYPKGLILSGGLAQQKHIKNRVLQMLRASIDQNIVIIPRISKKSWNWVASGAALSELSGTSLFRHSIEYTGPAN